MISLRFLPRCFPHYPNPAPPPPPPPPPSPTQVPEVDIDIVQLTSQPPPDNYLNHGPTPAPSNIIAAESSPIICFNSITLLIRELELGKFLFNIGIPITTAVLTSDNDSKKFHTTFAYLMLSGLSIGSMAIWNGIAIRTTFPRTANVVEQLGILMVLLSFTGLFGSALPPEFMCEKSFKRQK